MFESFQTNFAEGPSRPWILYGLFFLFLVIVLVVLSNKRFRSLPIIGTMMEKRETNRKAKVYWENTLANPVLKVNTSELPSGFQGDNYTMLLDLVWLNTRSLAKKGVLRHIVHKGSDELQMNMDSGATQMCPMTGSGSGSGSSGMTPSGLPQRMNPGIFADPYLNDILLYIDTEYENKHIRESVRIADIPMDVPFRLAIVVQKRSLEVYINCRLEVSKVLNGMPLQVDPAWYGRAGQAPFVGQIQNLKLWPIALTTNQLSTQCPMPIEFKNKEIPCNPVIGEEPKADSTQITAPSNPLLTYGTALSVCKS
jgi:hypothetical protein